MTEDLKQFILIKEQLLTNILTNIQQFSGRNAFFINDQFYTYADFAKKIAGISSTISAIPSQSVVGVITIDSLETYASIVALWINELIFVPISPSNSKERNESAINQANINYILSPTIEEAEIINTQNKTVITTSSLSSDEELHNLNTNPNNVLYILFTSGSTGTPKGVPITRVSLETFIVSFLNLGYQLNHNDRFLQIYDLSFDASLHCYVLPLFLGACIYTIPTNEVKYLYAYRLMKEQNLTFVKMPPSTITYLRPYFSKINLQDLKYTLFGGEALQSNLASEWNVCAPNSAINNVYGPTEATINCFYYNIDHNGIKNFNNITSIGKPFGDTKAIVLDENENILSANQKGELCIHGNQITQGYWKDSQKNKKAFVKLTFDEETLLFYKTGDLVYFDDEGDYFFCERIDNQVQIQGYRVELGELEHHARNKTKLNHVAALTNTNINGATQLFLFLENYLGDMSQLKDYLSEKVPQYMLPHKIISLPSFPLSTSGKIDRNKLKSLI